MRIFLKYLLVVAACCGTSGAIAGKNKDQLNLKIKRLAQEYQLQQAALEQSRTSADNNVQNIFKLTDDDQDRRRCRPDKVSCIKAVCDKMPSYNCDDASELERVTEICRGSNGNCINESCSKMPSYNCDDLHEIETIARACQGVGHGCLNSVCSKMPSYNCDDRHEVEAVAKACRGSSGECVDAICARMPSYNCDDLSELTQIAKQCSGRD
jgi:hypothetical protein